MKALIALTLTSTLFIFACAPQERMDTQAAASTPLESVTHNYRCQSGKTVAATYPTPDSATIQYQGVSHTLQIAVSGSGSRYVGEGFEWWTKGSGTGSEGTLFQHQADGTTGESLEFCTGL